MPELGAGIGQTVKTVLKNSLEAETPFLPLAEVEIEGKYDHNIITNTHIEGGIEIAAAPAIPVSLKLGGSRDRNVTDNSNLRVYVRYLRLSFFGPGTQPHSGGGGTDSPINPPTDPVDAGTESPFLGGGNPHA